MKLALTSFDVGYLLRGDVFNIPSESPYERINFCKRVKWRQLLGQSQSPLPYLSTGNPAGLICVGPVHAAMVSVNLSVNKSCFIWKTLFALNHPSLLVLKVFLCLLLHDSLIAERRGLMKTSYLEVSCLKSFVLETLTCISI